MSFRVKLNYHNLPVGVPEQLQIDEAALAAVQSAGVPDLVYHAVESLEVRLPHKHTLRIFETPEDVCIVMEAEGEEPYALETIMKEDDPDNA